MKSKPSPATRRGPGLGAFHELAKLKRWVPYRLVWNSKREKFDKVPHNGIRGLSTANPNDWMDQADALAVAEANGLDGIGLIMTGGIEVDSNTLVGVDVDDTDSDFVMPLRTYTELSPSQKGQRAFCWVPTAQVVQHKDTIIKPPHCKQIELYVGSAARFLTVTFDRINDEPIARLPDLGDWKLNKVGACDKSASAPEIPDGGTPIDLINLPGLSPNQRHLVDGTGEIDRSAILHGLIIKLLDDGVLQEDVLASLLKTPGLWQYCLDHRHGNPIRAVQFARDEVLRAYPKSQAGMRGRLVPFSSAWKPQGGKSAVSFPAAFPGSMADVVAAGLEAAHKPQLELTTMAALSAMAAACGSFYKQRDGSRLNLYCLGIARTGTGKDLPLRLARLLARQALAKVIGAPGSGQGLEDALVSNIATYCTMDEVAHVFSAMNDPKAPAYARANARKFLELFSASGDVLEVRPLAGKEVRTIPYPAFNLIGFTTPEKLGKAFSPDDFADGLAGRILFVSTDDNPPARRVRKPLELPDSVKNTAMRVAGRIKYLIVTGATTIEVDETAEQALDLLLTEFDQVGRTAESPWASALCVRSLEKVERIAGVLAVWDNPDKPTVTLEHVEWAAQFVRASDAAVLGFVDDYMHGGAEQDNAATLLRMLRDGKTRPKPERRAEVAASAAGWVARSALMRRAKTMNKKEFDAAVAYLEAQGEIKTDAFMELKVIGVTGDG